MTERRTTYSQAICEAFHYLLSKYDETFVLGQGLWSPWYVGNTMKDLEKKFGSQRVIDTPVAENGVTGIAVGASTTGMRPIVVHPRMDFMLYAMDPIVNEAAKWSYIFDGKASAPVTIRGIINRGGEQGAQHSQSLHAWFSHIPGLRVVMPASVSDARDLLISAVLSDDPVLYIDDRWLYEQEDWIEEPQEFELSDVKPKKLSEGDCFTIVASGYSVSIAKQVRAELAKSHKHASVFDLRVLNPIDCSDIVEDVKKTGRLLVIDGGWKNCGLAGEVIAMVAEALPISSWKDKPIRVTLPDAPAPAANVLEKVYYTSCDSVITKVKNSFSL